jgi:hypothetical protein
MIDGVLEGGKCCRMEMNVEKSKVMRMSRHSSSVQITIDEKQPENVEYFNCFGILITNGESCTPELQPKISMVSAAFNNKKTFHQQIELKFEEESSGMLHLKHIFYDAEIRDSLKVLKFDAGEGWRSVGPIA